MQPQQKVKLLKVEFGTEIEAREIPAFRGAIAAKVGREHHLFHNHRPGDKNYFHRYPLIQYKRLGRHPMILCMYAGVEEIHKYFEKNNWDIQLNGRDLEMKIHRLDMNQFELRVWDKMLRYQLFNWLGLNQQKYQEFEEVRGLAEKATFLEKILVQNILSFAKGMDWHIEEEVKVKILDIPSRNWIRFKGLRMLAQDLQFESNVFLPNFIGLGGKVSVGFGTLRELRVKEGRSRRTHKIAY